MKPLNGMRTPGSWSDTASISFSFQLAMIGLGEAVAQEAESRHHGGVAVFVRIDVDQRDREHVAPLGALDVHRPGQRMHQIQIDRRRRPWAAS